MKVLQFTIPVAHDRTVIVQEDDMPHFYPYLHRHREAQLIWIKEGEGTLIVANNMYAFQKGDVYLLGANQPHLLKSNPVYFEENSGLKIQSLMIFFDPQGKLAPVLALPEMQWLATFMQQHQNGFKVPQAHQAHIVSQMEAVQQAGNTEVMVSFLNLFQSLQQLNNQLEPLSTSILSGFSESEGLRIGHIFNFLMQNYHRNISLEEVAAEAHLTPQAFCRYFKKHTRQTFIAFLNELRINEACKKLTSSQFENIASVAYTCGFNNITNFNRVFRSVKGQAPKAYFKRLLQI
ncbi:AraC family transcriptional regulator [Pedobacter sp. KR3-3]|uniref:AraC family transcriptional regulator n=1 Tax=Pedobacter albus TaxID=3113905 RepID=A0ABU7I5U5_9SPHI|nr:AraC family transcriptional regulator [Pedobacter sp. KR3-3]MEE1944848.1 AraC family transcriptional regulator [Pedobacter sp. KR3-3]